MSVSGGRLNLRVTEQLPDLREAFAQGQRPRSIRVTEVAQEAEGGGDVGDGVLVDAMEAD